MLLGQIFSTVTLLYLVIIAVNYFPILVIGWHLLREVLVLMYAPTLHEDALASAEALAKGQDYCLIATDEARYIDELDARKVVVDAFTNYPFKGRNFQDPHFGIKVEGDDNYYWSIREREFVTLPAFSETYYPATCVKDYLPAPSVGQ